MFICVSFTFNKVNSKNEIDGFVNLIFNSKLSVSFLPEGVRWIPVGRGDYWILKLDDDYQTVLVGEPKRKYLWILSRTPQLKKEQIQEYLNYAKSQGYNVSDVIYPEHRP